MRVSLSATILAVLSATAAGQSATPSTRLQQFLIDARDRQCIAIFAQHPGPIPAVQSFEITKTSPAGGPQYIVQGRGACFCSPTGNCSFWVVVPAGDSFRVLLRTSGVQNFLIKSQITRGRPDLDLSMHGSAFDSTHRLYRFDGQTYRKTECSEWNYQDKNDPDHILSEPRITQC